MTDRPAGVPEGAEWSDKDQEWILGPRDETGEFHGDVSYWRPDGTLCCVCPHEHGKPHGLSKRFHESGEVSQSAEYVQGELHGARIWYASSQPTTEKMHSPGMGKNITRAEVQYTHGVASAFRYFDAEGRQTEAGGAPLPERPAGVPNEALFRKNGSMWIAATFLENGEPDGLSRSWDSEGRLFAEERFKAGKRHGISTFYDIRGSGARRLSCGYADGLLDGPFEVFWPDGKPRRRTLMARDTFAAPLEDWGASGQVLPAIDVPRGAGAAPSAAADAMADLIAAGWGGSDERDAAGARAARARVKRDAPPALWARLCELGLDRAPRLITEARVERVIAALREFVDENALAQALIAQGGPAVGVALARGGPAALAMLEARRKARRMSLTNLGMVEAPVLLARFAALDELDLTHNRLTTLPRELGALVCLRKLELGHNQIRALPVELARLSELQSLHLNDNGLESLPDGMCALRAVETLNLGDNALASLPPELGELDRLHTVWLHGNPLTTLPREMTRMTRLSFLHLGDVQWAEPPACLWEIPSLEELWLAGPKLERLPPEVARLPKLRRLCLWYSNLSEIPEALYGMTQLQELRISHNPLPERAVERLREALPDCTIY